MENLTDEIEKRARELIEEIRKKGGVTACIESGYIQKEIQDASYISQKQLEEKETLQVGTNIFLDEEEKQPPLLRMNLELQKKQIDDLHKCKANRDEKKTQDALKNLLSKAKTEENILPHIFIAVKAKASLGEICDSLRTVYGEHKEKYGI